MNAFFLDAVLPGRRSFDMSCLRSRTSFVVAFILGLSLAGCGDSGGNSGGDVAGAVAKAALPESYWSTAEPAGARPVAEVKAAAKNGDEVVVVGRVGGERKVFSDTRASFLIVDPALKACGEHGTEDPCKYPWDFCCEDKAAIRAGAATIEFRDGDRVLKADARGFHGLDHLKTVVVRGRAERDSAGNLTVVATALHVRP